MKLPLILIAGLGPICINDADGKTIVDGLMDAATGEAIVRAVNCHYALVTAMTLWKVAVDNSEECEIDEYASCAIPMPLFCDADEATDVALEMVTA
jgi:hypothetical protein